MAAQIIVDHDRCQNALECHQCVLACPRGALSLLCTAPSLRGVENDAKDYAVMGRHIADCTGCLDCVTLCPEKAIQVTFN